MSSNSSMDLMVPVCPLLSTRSGVLELCLQEQCAWYIAPVNRCALYVVGHKGAVELQQLQKPTQNKPATPPVQPMQPRPQTPPA